MSWGECLFPGCPQYVNKSVRIEIQQPERLFLHGGDPELDVRLSGQRHLVLVECSEIGEQLRHVVDRKAPAVRFAAYLALTLSEARSDVSSPEVRTRSRKGETVHSFRWAEDMPLNGTRFDLGVNLLIYT